MDVDLDVDLDLDSNPDLDLDPGSGYHRFVRKYLCQKVSRRIVTQSLP